MTAKKYFQLSFFLPLILPVILCLGVWGYHIKFTAPDRIIMIAGVFGWSVVIGGLPYLIFLAGVLRWSSGARTAAEIYKFNWFAPLLYGCVFACFGIVVSLLGIFWGFSYIILALPFVLQIAIEVGYVYVIVVNGIYCFGKRLHCFPQELAM